jgi:hypothetical protein
MQRNIGLKKCFFWDSLCSIYFVDKCAVSKDRRLKALKMASSRSDEFTDFDGHQVRKYHFPLDKIPRLHYEDPKAQELIKNEVIIFLDY